MTASPEVSPEMTCQERALGVALRMLDGSASCAVHAWRIGSQYDFVAHGRNRAGQLLVALLPDSDCPFSTLPSGVGEMVRVDLVRHSMEVMLSVVAASAHMIGELVLLSDAEILQARAVGDLPERIAELTASPGVRVGVIETDRVLVHDHSGVTALGWPELARREAPVLDPFDAHHAVVRLGVQRLRQLCHAVRNGGVIGQATVRPSAAGLCGHVRNQVFCVDVDSAGVTLMHVGDQETAVVYAPFAGEATTLSMLSLELERLMMDSEPVRNQRI